MAIDIKNEIEVRLRQRQLEEKRHQTPAHRRIKLRDAEEIFSNQTQAMQEHLIHDNHHRMLNDAKIQTRSNRPVWVQERAAQMERGGRNA